MPGNLVNVSSAPRCFNERCSWSAAWRAHTHTHIHIHNKHHRTFSAHANSFWCKNEFGLVLLWTPRLHLFFRPYRVLQSHKSSQQETFRSVDGHHHPPLGVCVLVCAHPIGLTPYLPHTLQMWDSCVLHLHCSFNERFFSKNVRKSVIFMCL